MMRCLTTPIALFMCVLLYGQGNGWNSRDCIDSLIIQPASESELYLQWRIGNATTLRTITIETGFTYDQLLNLNPILRFRDLEPCDIALSPFRPDMIDSMPYGRSRPLYYRVRQQETLFGIARRILDISVHKILDMNNMHDEDLRIGQVLLVGWLRESSNDFADEPTASTLEWSPGHGYLLDTHSMNTSPGTRYTKQKGVAWWNKTRPDSNFFALHRTAPVNSLIEIRNPMFGRTVWAKVIGTIPPTYTEDISVIVSQGVAKYLGAIDGRFYVEMSYELR